MAHGMTVGILYGAGAEALILVTGASGKLCSAAEETKNKAV